ncbi:MAG: glutamine--tRNA ligase/YqeY domain fusion protein [Planctomycetota bacterium]
MNTSDATPESGEKSERTKSLDFIRTIIAEDLQSGKHDRIHTRFPPEPNGYLHIGHAKSICLNFDVAAENQGQCNLRFDDTNPEAEEEEFVQSIQDDVRWLGFDWEDRLFFASDYFDRLYEIAVQLIKDGKAYVESLPPEQISEYRGKWNEPGKDSPYRDRPIEESLDLFDRMRQGEFAEGTHALRAKIDMSSKNMNLRDPILYRIKKAHHHRTGDKWCVYPTYDYTHPISDAIEGITHSLCTLEFEDHRPLYDWAVESANVGCQPRQIEFAKLNLNYTIVAKRRLKQLVQEGRVSGWDDPRLPTLRGLRRRGYTPEAVRAFCRRVGITKNNSVTDVALLEHTLREDLNKTSSRVMAVLRPLKVVIENYPDGQVEQLEAVNNPEDPSAGTRQIPFSKVLFIERDDFMEDPPKKFFRLAPGREVRLRYAYFITCQEVIKDDQGEVVELRCTYDPATRGGDSPDGRKVKATLHWVTEAESLKTEVRLYERLFDVESPSDESDGKSWMDHLNPDSLEIVSDARVEPSVQDAEPGTRFQFERLGYFCVDRDSSSSGLVFNRTVTLKDAWTKLQKKG